MGQERERQEGDGTGEGENLKGEMAVLTAKKWPVELEDGHNIVVALRPDKELQEDWKVLQ